jgi:c-di-GMP-binding flagellar brake protein YcgR
MELMQKEQRRWERYPVKIRTKITINSNGETSSFYGEATDVSRGGLKLFMPRDVAASIVLLLELALPYNSRPMAIRGIIRNRTGFSYGIEFIRISKYEQETIAQACKTLQLLK